MKLINVEEHYMSKNVSEKMKKIFSEQEGNVSLAVEDATPGAADLAEIRIPYMDDRKIDVQVISHAGALPATMEKKYAVPLCKELNDEMYEEMKKNPGRFYAFAHLPLSSPEDAAIELERCVKELGFVGTMLSSHYKDLPYDDEFYFPIFEKAQELDVPVYLHPGMVREDVVNAYYKGDWNPRTTYLLSGFGIGWHYDVGMQAVRMMTSGLFDRLPKLKIILGHWGELVSFFMYRLDEMIDAGVNSGKKFSDYFKENIYVNPSGMLYPEQLRYCLETFGADHILWGEDYPYRKKEDIRTFLEEFPLSDEEREKIAHGNAEQLFHIGITPLKKF